MKPRIRCKLLSQVPVVASDAHRGPDALERFRRTGDAKLYPAAVRIVGERLAKLAKLSKVQRCYFNYIGKT